MAVVWALALGFLGLLLLLLLLWIVRAPSATVPIEGRHVLISGGSSGIGLDLAKLVASQGARKVTLLARNVDRLEQAKQQVLDSLNGTIKAVNVEVVSADVVDFASVERAIAEAGPVDVLVCSHGVSVPCSFEDSSQKDNDMVVDINFKGTMNIVKAALPGMKNDNGAAHARSIVIFSSQAGQSGIYGYAAYAGSKAALRGFAEALKQELFVHNIQVSIIYPPDTYTPGFVEENKNKPEITKILSASSRAMKATDVAKITLEGIKAGKFNVPCNFDGHLLCLACSGMSPQTSARYALLEIVLLPIVRIISLCVQYGWYGTIAEWDKKQKKRV